jgi:hypothetical protein
VAIPLVADQRFIPPKSPRSVASAQRHPRKSGVRAMLLKREPVLWQMLILAILNLLVVFDVLHLTDAQLGAVNTAMAAVLGFLVRTQVTPLANPTNAQGQALAPTTQSATQHPTTPMPPRPPVGWTALTAACSQERRRCRAQAPPGSDRRDRRRADPRHAPDAPRSGAPNRGHCPRTPPRCGEAVSSEA